MIIIKKEAKILSAESKPYDFQGRTGVSHKVRALLEDGEIYTITAKEEDIKELKDKVGDDGELELKLSSPKERLRLDFVSFK